MSDDRLGDVWAAARRHHEVEAGCEPADLSAVLHRRRRAEELGWGAVVVFGCARLVFRRWNRFRLTQRWPADPLPRETADAL